MASRSHRRTARSRRGRLVLATGVVLVAGALTVPAVNAATTEATATTPSAKRLHDDFNGDGHPDLAIGAPGTAPDGETRAGAISVLYGSSGGLSTSRKQVLNRPGDEYSGGYGSRLQSADLDGDGYADLLSSVGQYMFDVDSGYALVVNWGGPKGLSATTTTLTWAPQYEWQGDSPSRTWTVTSVRTWSRGPPTTGTATPPTRTTGTARCGAVLSPGPDNPRRRTTSPSFPDGRRASTP